jgi:quercetin dioxygenase-like cupin family protein
VGGYRFLLTTVPPGTVSVPPDVDVRAGLTEMEQKLPGVLACLEPGNPGMHTTDTIDFEVVLSGAVILELDDGAEKELRPGDTVVQNGTRHRWTNRGTQPAVMAVFTALPSDPGAR